MLHAVQEVKREELLSFLGKAGKPLEEIGRTQEKKENQKKKTVVNGEGHT